MCFVGVCAHVSDLVFQARHVLESKKEYVDYFGFEQRNRV